MTIEMEALRDQLTAIFASLRYDENCVPIIRKNLNKNLLNNLTDMKFVKNDWIPIEYHSSYYNEKIKLLNESLNEWVIHHIQNIK